MAGYPYSTSYLPNQMESLDKKLGKFDQNGKYTPTKWGEESMDFFDFIGSMQTREKKKDWKNYQLFNGQYDFADYEYVTKPFEDQFGDIPSQMRHFSIVSAPIKVLYGEMKAMPLSFFCKAEDQDSKNEYTRTRADLLHQYIQTQFLEKLKEQGVDISNPEVVQSMTPPEIQEYMARSYSSTAEQWSQSVLQFEIKKNDIKAKLLEGFKDGLIVGKEFYMSTIVNGEPLFRLLNPLYTFYDKSLDVEFVDEGDFAGIRPFLTPSEIIQSWGKFMSEEQIREVMDYGNFGRRGTYNNSTGINSIQFDVENKDILFTDYIFSDSNMNDVFSTLFSDQSTLRMARIPVTIAFWKSKRKIGYLHYFDEEGAEQMMLVDENYKEQEEQGEWIEWDWVNQVWEGTKIGTDIYLNIRPLAYQGVSIYRIYECKLPITGVLYNTRNSRPTSLLDEMKPYQEQFNIHMYELEKDTNTNLGKIMFMSLRHIPKSKGWDEKKWLWYLKALKIAWVDDSVENLKGQQSNFSHFQTADASLMGEIAEKIKILEWLKNECNYIAGISPQRLGEVQTTETLGGVERSIQQSSAQSQIYYQTHQRVVQRALTIHLNTCQVAYSDNRQLSFFLDDMSRAFTEIDGAKLSLADLGVFLTDSAEDYRVLNAVRAMAQPAMQNGADLADVLTVETDNSIAKIKDTLEKLKKERIAREQQQLQMEQQKVQAAMEDKEKDRQWQSNENQLDREKDLQVAEMKIVASESLGAKETDVNQNNVPDFVEVGQLALEQSRHNFERALGLKSQLIDEKKLRLDQEKLQVEKQMHKDEMKLSDKELKQKKYSDDMKLRVAKQNKKNKPPTKK